MKFMQTSHSKVPGFDPGARCGIVGAAAGDLICQSHQSQFSRCRIPSMSWRWPKSRAPFLPSSDLRSARTPAWRPGTTGTRRRRWRCATASCTAGSRPRSMSYDAGRKRVYYLSPRIPDRPSVHRCPEQYGTAGAVRRGARRSRRRPVGPAQVRAGRRARQWRSRAAGRMLHGKHGDARHSRDRLRHPLRFRPVPPDHR